MAAPTPPLTPKTHLRNGLAQIYAAEQQAQALYSEAMRLAERTSQLPGLQTEELQEAARKVHEGYNKKTRECADQWGVLIGAYLNRNGDIAELANRIFGASDSAQKTAYLQRIREIEQIARAVRQ